MDSIKDAFQKVKQDIDILRLNLDESNKGVLNLHEEIKKINENLEKMLKDSRFEVPTHTSQNPTFQQISPINPTDFQHIKHPFSSLGVKNQVFSSGNEGVPTDRQTDRQTDTSAINYQKNIKNSDFSLKNASELLSSLDGLKKEIRLKFKRLTGQEMLVFSAIYQIGEEQGFSDYKILSRKLGLTESSIRDYVGRLIKKGIPVDKIKINNKTVNLSISKNLKDLASLSTIIQLREI
ncbi:MAG TPA: hypothetical protein VJ208_04160 [Candidatus Nanoarchaeia archaeon]|nr:hypothetical protein [Candidatus Nanoarchaeia archaeon]